MPKTVYKQRNRSRTWMWYVSTVSSKQAKNLDDPAFPGVMLPFLQLLRDAYVFGRDPTDSAILESFRRSRVPRRTSGFLSCHAVLHSRRIWKAKFTAPLSCVALFNEPLESGLGLHLAERIYRLVPVQRGDGRVRSRIYRRQNGELAICE